MKRFLLLFISMLIFSFQAFAMVPAFLTYSGKITDKNSNLLPDGAYDMRFSFWNTATGGTGALWTDNHYIADGYGVTVTAGGFNVLLGGANTALPADFSVNYYLQTEVHINGNWEVFGRRTINSVAYAKQAEVANTANTANAANLANQVADNCITTSKIANGAVTADKISSLPGISGGMIFGQTITGANLVNGTITQTQASFAPRVIENGAWNYSSLLQSGTATTDSNGNLTITFPCGYTSPPMVVCTPGRGDSSGFIIVIVNVSNTTFTVKSGWPATVPMSGAATFFYWIAIGS